MFVCVCVCWGQNLCISPTAQTATPTIPNRTTVTHTPTSRHGVSTQVTAIPGLPVNTRTHRDKCVIPINMKHEQNKTGRTITVCIVTHHNRGPRLAPQWDKLPKWISPRDGINSLKSAASLSACLRLRETKTNWEDIAPPMSLCPQTTGAKKAGSKPRFFKQDSLKP